MPTLKYSKTLLDFIIERDKATLVEDYLKVNRETSIVYICHCGNEHTKNVRYIVDEGGALCVPCGKIAMVERQRQTMLNTHGATHAMFIPKFKKKQEETMITNHGVSHNSLNPDTIQKRKDTLQKHFGVAHHFQLPEKIAERRDNCIQKYGVEHHLQLDDILEKQRQTNRDKRGVDYSLQSPEVRAKGITTNLERYGVEHPSQSTEIMEKTQKNAKKYKEFKFPSGSIRKVQGYEPFALQELLVAGYIEDQILTERKDVPRITYEVDGKKRYYFPDIFIPHENKIIEVKSTWTYKCKTDNIELKKKATLNTGYAYEIWCYAKKGKRVDTTSEEPNNVITLV